MTQFLPYNAHVGREAVRGDLRIHTDLPGPGISPDETTRDVLVWLPPGYDSTDRRYPVLYMHDAQNVFDPATSYGGATWEADATLLALHEEGIDLIVVAIPNGRNARASEYSPYDFHFKGTDTHARGAGDQYVNWLIDRVKPLIDSTFRTLPDAAQTGIAGSSMGGLISLYAHLMRPDVFGLCGAFSTAYWFGDNGLLTTTRERARGAGKVYLDVGTREGETIVPWGITTDDPDAAYVQGVVDLREALIAGGYVAGETLLYVEEAGALHREGAWARRLPDALRFLFG